MEASAEPRFSVVIPAYNEERLLPGLLDSIDAACEIYGGGSGAIEVIVADNASTDSTASLAASRGCLVVPVEKRVIAAARNGGARAGARTRNRRAGRAGRTACSTRSSARLPMPRTRR